MAHMSDDAELIPVFMPALGTILLSAEDKKSEPLTQDEVIEIRDNAACIMMNIADSTKMAESRGYVDLDPENCWYDWQMLRRELGRKRDLDPGARVNLFSSEDPAYQATIVQARESLDILRLSGPPHATTENTWTRFCLPGQQMSLRRQLRSLTDSWRILLLRGCLHRLPCTAQLS